MTKIKTDCCGNVEEYLIADEFGDGRVRVEGNCPICGEENPLGTIEDEGRKPPRYSVHALRADSTLAERIIGETDELAACEQIGDAEPRLPWGWGVLDRETGLVDAGFGFGVPLPEADHKWRMAYTRLTGGGDES